MTDVLDDLVTQGLRVVICGTAVGPASRKRQAYYAGPGNRFWTILAETGLTSVLLQPTEYRTLLEYGIGLTDVVKEQSGLDKHIDFAVRGNGRLRATVAACRPRVLCFNGKRAAREGMQLRRVPYGWHPELFGATRIFVAPSTSGAARRWWSADPWHELATYLRIAV